MSSSLPRICNKTYTRFAQAHVNEMSSFASQIPSKLNQQAPSPHWGCGWLFGRFHVSGPYTWWGGFLVIGDWRNDRRDDFREWSLIKPRTCRTPSYPNSAHSVLIFLNFPQRSFIPVGSQQYGYSLCFEIRCRPHAYASVQREFNIWWVINSTVILDHSSIYW